MQIKSILQNKYSTNFGNKKYVAPKMKTGTAEEVGLALDKVLNSKDSSGLKLGELINTGTYADVYSLDGWPNSYVVRIERTEVGKSFNPKELIPSKDIENNILYETSDKLVSIRKRISGEPLHGKNWRNTSIPSPDDFRKTMAELFELPDQTYEKYIDDILLIRKRGFNIDTWNPNNYLLDKINKRINIIDLLHSKHYGKDLEIKDFFGLLDSKRLNTLCYMKDKISLEELADIVTKFLDRMISIADKKGFKLEVPEAAKEPLAQFYQDYAILLYRKAEILFK